MAVIKIGNDQLQVVISTLGAEIQAITRKDDGFDYIWNDVTGEYWQRHAPILFPVIGRLNDNRYLYHGQEYELLQHGFLRDQEFYVVMSDTNFVKLQSAATNATLKKYPFNYQFTVLYQLVGQSLEIRYEIVNQDNKTMYYSLGLHPGFTVTHDLETYQLVLSPSTTEIRELEINPVPYLNGISHIDQLQNGVIPLNYPLLDKGLRIYSAADFDCVTLTSSQSKYSVQLSLADFPYLAVWSPEHRQAPFICVELFRGLPDVAGQVGKIQDKSGGQSILAGNAVTIQTKLTLCD